MRKVFLAALLIFQSGCAGLVEKTEWAYKDAPAQESKYATMKPGKGKVGAFLADRGKCRVAAHKATNDHRWVVGAEAAGGVALGAAVAFGGGAILGGAGLGPGYGSGIRSRVAMESGRALMLPGAVAGGAAVMALGVDTPQGYFDQKYKTCMGDKGHTFAPVTQKDLPAAK